MLAARRHVIIGIKGNAIARLIQVGVFGDGCASAYAVREIVDWNTIEIVAGQIEAALELKVGTREARGIVNTKGRTVGG